MNVVTFHNVTKKYGAQSALHGISFSVNQSEFLVIVGPSGCGKSTVLRIMAGLERHTTGMVQFGGRNAATLSPGERNVGMVFQNYALYPHLTVFENLAFGLKAARIPKQTVRERVFEVAKLLELDDMLAKKPGQLSGGQKQRVALGRALVRQPAVFLMDEPLSNLDAVLREKMRMDLRRLHEQTGTATVYVTHDQVEAMTMADRILVMQQGEIHQIGTPAEVYHEPATLFVARFFGSPPMNAIHTSVCRKEGNWTLVSPHHGERATITHPEAHRKEWETLATQPSCWLGFRPEFTEAGRSEGIQFSVRVTDVETLGPRSHVHARWGDDPLAFVLEHGQPVPERGATVQLTAPISHLHWFDEQQRRLRFANKTGQLHAVPEAVLRTVPQGDDDKVHAQQAK